MAARALGILVLLTLVAGATAAAAAPRSRLKPEARVHLERGLKLYDKQRYDEAIVELRAGLAVDPQPDLLYALGQAERRRGNCKRAIEYYQSAIALVQDPKSVAALRVQIERCHVENDDDALRPRPPEAEPPAAAATPPPEPPPAPKESAALPASDDDDDRAAAAAAPVATASRAPQRPWHHDALGWSLVAVGLAGIAAGGALVGIARARADAADASYQQFADARSAPTLWTGGIITLAAGGALTLGGVIRFGVIAARRSHAEPR